MLYCHSIYYYFEYMLKQNQKLNSIFLFCFNENAVPQSVKFSKYLYLRRLIL